MVSIRLPKTDELDRLVEISRLMSEESPNYRDEIFDVEKATRVVKHIIDTGCGVVADEYGTIIGMMGGFLVSAPMHEYNFITDMGIYILPSHRGGSTALRLIKAFEDIATEKGTKKIFLGISTGIEAERTVKLYEKLGYKMFSYCMVKNV